MNIATMNLRSRNGTVVTGLSEYAPSSIELRYNRALNSPEKAEVERVVNYWMGANTIVGHGAPVLTGWVNDRNLVIYAPFETGAFRGDLTHRNALLDGDSSFTIGLCSLFDVGYTCITSRGHGCKPIPHLIPLVVDCQYTLRPTPRPLERVTWRNYEQAPLMHAQLLVAGILRR